MSSALLGRGAILNKKLAFRLLHLFPSILQPGVSRHFERIVWARRNPQ
jgi:hypothetical protein